MWRFALLLLGHGMILPSEPGAIPAEGQWLLGIVPVGGEGAPFSIPGIGIVALPPNNEGSFATQYFRTMRFRSPELS